MSASAYRPSILELPTKSEPLGRGLRRFWSLDPNVCFLNHGSFGATPRSVQDTQARWRGELEAEPVRFMVDVLPDALRAASNRLAQFVGATPANLAFVENATSGVNAVLRSIHWKAGERIVVANHAYPAIKNTARYLAARYGLTVVEADIPWPLTGADAIVEAYSRALANGARVAIIDHIFSPLAVVTPLAEVAAVCRKQGTQMLVDGAHAPGLLPLSLDVLGDMGVDWYTGNCHKWLCAPKGCGFLYATPEAQRDLHPTVISNFYGEGFEQEFAWTGTGDPSARLSVPAAIDFIEALGDERYRAALFAQAREGAARLTDAWQVRAGAPLECFASMVTLPLPVDTAANAQSAAQWRRTLLHEHGIEVPVLVINDQLWVRISAQVYNEASDIERLAAVFATNR